MSSKVRHPRLCRRKGAESERIEIEMSDSASAPYRMRGFRPVEAARPDLWAPGVVVFDSGPVHVETTPPLLSLKCVFDGEEFYDTDRPLTVRRREWRVASCARLLGFSRRG